jgi:hypothetical protein
LFNNAKICMLRSFPKFNPPPADKLFYALVSAEACQAEAGRGNSIVTVVPLPGSLSICNDPPFNCIIRAA